MKSDLVRWAAFGVTAVLLIWVQVGVWTFFISRSEKPEYEIHAPDLKRIHRIWAKETKIESPKELVAAIEKAFGAAAIGEEQGPQQLDPTIDQQGEIYDGALVVVAVAYPTDGQGRPAVFFDSGGKREIYGPGDELPGGKILDSVDRIEKEGYRIHIRDPKNDKISTISFETEYP